MRFHDPQRPTVNFAPGFLGVRAVLPGIELIPLPEGQWWARVLCPVSYNAFSWRSATGPLEWVMLVVQHYAEDPEKTLREVFGWEPPEVARGARPQGAQAPARAPMSIEDFDKL